MGAFIPQSFHIKSRVCLRRGKRWVEGYTQTRPLSRDGFKLSHCLVKPRILFPETTVRSLTSSCLGPSRQSTQAALEEGCFAMRDRFGSCETKRPHVNDALFDHGVQIEIEIAPGSETTAKSMLLNIITSLGFLIPPSRAARVEPGNLYIRRNSQGAHFVRKRERTRSRERMDCDSRKKTQRRSSVLGWQEARIIERKARLEAELAAAEEAEMRARIGIREPRPYHHSGGSRKRNASEPDLGASQSRCCRSFVYCDTEPGTSRHHPHLARQNSRRRLRPETPYYIVASPEGEFHIGDGHPAASCQSHGRRSCLRRSSQHLDDEEMPVFYQKIIRHGRRKNSSYSCHHRSKHYYPRYAYDWECRAPEADEYEFY